MNTRTQAAWLADILEAVDAIRDAEATLDEARHLSTSDDLDAALDGVVADALTYRVMTIGEAVKHLSTTVTEARPDVPWSDIARMRDVVTHHYHRRNVLVIRATVDEHLASLYTAVEWLLHDWPGRARLDDVV